MRYLLLTLLVLGIAAVAGRFLLEDPGFVVIGYGGQALRMSFAVFVLLLATLLIATYLATRLLLRLAGLRRTWARWSRTRRHAAAERGLTRGLLEHARGNWALAERLLARSAPKAPQPLLHWLAAARAAQALAAHDRRDRYLALAAEEDPDAVAEVECERAELALARGDHAVARAALDIAGGRAPDHPRVLRLVAQLHAASGEWEALQALLPRVARTRALDTRMLAGYERAAAAGVLRAARASSPPGDADTVWARVPKRLRDDPELLAEHARNLQAAGRGQQAEVLLRHWLENDWSDDLAALYGHVSGTNAGAQLDAAERWLRARPEDPTLLLALGRLSHRAELWGKARTYLEAALRHGAPPDACLLLADTLGRAGDTEAARRYSLEGLRRALAEQPLALPAPRA